MPYALTAPFYIYRVLFKTRDLPELPRRQYLAEFPRTEREVWVQQRQVRNELLALDPSAAWEKHEARKCERCGRWWLGIAAQMFRDRIQAARLQGRTVACCNSCNKTYPEVKA